MSMIRPTKPSLMPSKMPMAHIPDMGNCFQMMWTLWELKEKRYWTLLQWRASSRRPLDSAHGLWPLALARDRVPSKGSTRGVALSGEGGRRGCPGFCPRGPTFLVALPAGVMMLSLRVFFST